MICSPCVIVEIKGIESEGSPITSSSLKQLIIFPLVLAAAYTFTAYLLTDFFSQDTVGFSSFETSVLLLMIFLAFYLGFFLIVFLITQFTEKRGKHEKMPALK